MSWEFRSQFPVGFRNDLPVDQFEGRRKAGLGSCFTPGWVSARELTQNTGPLYGSCSLHLRLGTESTVVPWVALASP